jgi:4-hydroxybenzoate polyprenyltransferase
LFLGWVCFEGVFVLPNTTPLVVDLDGTLVRTDLLFESFFSAASKGVNHFWRATSELCGGKARLKAFLADAGPIDYALLPYNADVLQLIGAAKNEGRQVYLATASDKRHADGVAGYLALFDGVFASDGSLNLSGAAKAQKLVGTFGEGGFEYVGNSSVDIAIWRHAKKAYLRGTSAALARRVNELGVEVDCIDNQGSLPRVWLKALRVHQYVKNTLVFVPFLTAHVYTLKFLFNAILAFVAFSLCASSVYLLNDLVDLDADRRHPTKQNRPFASGALPLAHGTVAIPILLISSFLCASAASFLLVGVLAAYFVLTLAYSLKLKRKLMIDVVILAMLYTTRVIAGAAALPVIPSEWLLAFSMFAFTCLALIKRHAELALRIDNELPDPSNRNYRLGDLPIVGAMAAASGFNAVTIFALYVSSPTVKDTYRHPELLWLICPLLLYWFGRIVVLAHRRVVVDDPVVFAFLDRVSRLCCGAMIAIVLLAI